MVTIKIDTTGDGISWLYDSHNDWKDYCECENFDEEVVLFGNREFEGCKKASWYKKVVNILSDIENYDVYPTELSKEINDKIKSLYENCGDIEDIIADVARLLYPDETFTTGTIRGYTQNEWQDYIVKGSVPIELIEAIYFGKIADVSIDYDGEEFGDILTYETLWEAEQTGLMDFCKKKYHIDDHEIVKIYKADGFIQVLNWKEVV